MNFRCWIDVVDLMQPRVRKEHEWKLNSGNIINSCREVESKYVDLLAHTTDRQYWAVGPVHMLLESRDSSNMTKNECIEFLDKQEVNSVIYVSFGTTTTLTQEKSMSSRLV